MKAGGNTDRHVPPGRWVLVVGGTDDLLAELTRACGDACRLRPARPQDQPQNLAHDGACQAVLLVEPTGPEVARWRVVLDTAPSPACLAVLADDVADPRVDAWLEAGADDCVFRSHLDLLPVTLTRLRRDHARRAQRSQTEERLHAATAELLRLARGPRFWGDELEPALREVTQAGARDLGVARCSVWLLDETRGALCLADRYEAQSGRHARGARHPTQERRTTLTALLGQRLVAASDATVDPRLSAFAEPGVSSLIAVALLRRGALVGALCLEHFGPPRRWTSAEEAYAGALADTAAMALEAVERRTLEWALAQAERHFRDLFLHASDAMVMHRVSPDGDLLCEDLNPAAERATGLKRDDVVGHQAREVLDRDSAAELEKRSAQAIASRGLVVYEHELELPMGRRLFNIALVPFLDEAGRVHRLAAIARDVTARREHDSLHRRPEGSDADAQKDEALVRFGTHIAHDVNNLLTVIIAHAQRLQAMPGKARDTGQAILEATARGRELTQQVLTFGHHRPPERKALELGPLIRATLRLLEATAPGVSMRVDLSAQKTRVMGDEGQLNQVLTNLCANALNALPQGEGTLTVSLKAVSADDHPGLKPGPWVRLSVTDTGSGMDEATARRVFEPFFSTRPEGGGTGLGLAVVQSIVQGHDGTVVVDSSPGKGSTFHVYLPSLGEDDTRPGQGQHVMLVDDHPGMARVSAKLLETLGYRTSVFDDPRDALAAFRSRPQYFDVVMTDLSMPQMSGEEFTLALREVSPTVPVIVSSGMASEADREELQRLGFAGVLLKPWRVEEAVATLKRVLPDGPRA